MPSRQALHAAKQRRARGLKRPGRKPWTCPACGGTEATRRADGARRCVRCHPPQPVGRPRKRPVPRAS